MGREEGVSALMGLSSRDEERLGFSAGLFGDESEARLYDEASKAASELLNTLSNNRIDRSIDLMEGLVPVIDRYFDDVLVNCEEEDIRTNRHSFLARLREAFGLFCDFSALAGE